MFNLQRSVIGLIVLASLSVTVSSVASIPALDVIREYNLSYSQEFLSKISIPLAFIAGLISFLSPCVLPVLPMYFSMAFREKKNITRMTVVFSLGLSATITLMGLAAAYAGVTLISLQYDYESLIIVAGTFLVLFGVMAFLGRGFSFLHRKINVSPKGIKGVFASGVLFGIGWTPCIGPILSGILLMASVLGNYSYATLLMFSYSVGITIPLILFSLIYDKYDLSKNKYIRGKQYNMKIGNATYTLHSTQMISGLMLITIGLIFIAYKGTYIINTLDPLGTKMFVMMKQRSLLG